MATSSRPDGGNGPPPALLVVHPGTDAEHTVPIADRLFVGRELAGIDDSRRLVIDDDTVSREHLEIRLDHEQDRAIVIDMSTNGTRLNGTRIERAVPIPLHPGDRLAVGSTLLEFVSEQFTSGGRTDRGLTNRYVSTQSMALVVGDIVGYSTISERADSTLVLTNLEMLYEGLRRLLMEHGGTLNSYAGDAIFAVWEVDDAATGVARAVEFARAANEHVQEVAPRLELRSPDGGPLRMGWAVVLGPVAVSTFTRAQPAVIGDTTNLAFRLSGVAAREGFPEVLVTESARAALGDDDRAWAGPFTVRVKGRETPAAVFGLPM